MPLKENKMSLDAKLRKIANTARGQKGTYSLNIVHTDNCPAKNGGNLIQCNCLFKVTVKRKNSDQTVSAEKQKVSNKLAKRINEKSKKDISH